MTTWSFRSRTLTAIVAVAAVVLLGGVYAVAVDGGATGSVFVPISPVRVLDTRIGAGLANPLTSDQPATLQVTGSIPTVQPGDVIVAGVAGTGPSDRRRHEHHRRRADHDRFPRSSARLCLGEPSTSSINFTSPGAIVANAVTTELPTSGPGAGAIQLWFHGTSPTATTHVLVDIVGYYQPAAVGQSPGPPGPAGSGGGAGLPGAPGPVGPPAQTAARVGEPISTTLLAGATPLTWTAMALGNDGNPVVVVAETEANRLTQLHVSILVARPMSTRLSTRRLTVCP